jgi:hypothetical protein
MQIGAGLAAFKASTIYSPAPSETQPASSVEEINITEAKAVLKALTEDINQNWSCGYRPIAYGPDCADPAPWERRLMDTCSTLGEIEEFLGDEAEDTEEYGFYTCQYQGKPVGLMVISQDQHLPGVGIDYLVSHPGTENVGGLLIEHAVGISEYTGGMGKVYLDVMNDGAPKAYERLGFVMDAGSATDMSLDPQSSSQWQSTNGVWQLAKFSPKG